MAFRVSCIITDGKSVVTERGSLPCADASGGSSSLVDSAIAVARRVVPGQSFREIDCVSRANPLVFLFLVETFKVSSLGQDCHLVPVMDLVLEQDDLEDVVFGYFRAAQSSSPGLDPVLLVDGRPVILKDSGVWEGLARAFHAKAKGSVVELAGSPYVAVFGAKSRVSDQDSHLPMLEAVFKDLKDKYYPVSDSPSFQVVDTASPFLANTVAGGDGVTIQVNEALLSDAEHLRQVLAHELIHWRLFREGKDVAPHGESFDMLASEINAGEGVENYVSEFADDTCWDSEAVSSEPKAEG